MNVTAVLRLINTYAEQFSEYSDIPLDDFKVCFLANNTSNFRYIPVNYNNLRNRLNTDMGEITIRVYFTHNEFVTSPVEIGYGKYYSVPSVGLIPNNDYGFSIRLKKGKKDDLGRYPIKYYKKFHQLAENVVKEINLVKLSNKL